MWTPTSWAEVQLAPGDLAENDQLEFKRELPPGRAARDIAKDVAALSIAGGVIAVGIEETAGTASAIRPIPLQGAPERIQQIVDSAVRPPVRVEIQTLRENEGDADGMMLIRVPPSLSAPHEYEHRFPARSGATTRWLSEPEIERLYARRREIAERGTEMEGLGGFVSPPGAMTPGSGFVGIGQLSLFVRPAISVQHPAAPRLRFPLGHAVRDAAQVVDGRVAPPSDPSALEYLRHWTTRGSTGWTAGQAHSDFEQLKGGTLVAGTLMYGDGFSFLVTMGLDVADEGWRCAYEKHWASETMALLAIAGGFFSDIPEASLLRVDLGLTGLDGAVSWQASRRRAHTDDAPKVKDTKYSASGRFSAPDLAREPDAAVRELFDPLFVSIVDEGYDVVAALQSGN